jgi:hypothetical protein
VENRDEAERGERVAGDGGRACGGARFGGGWLQRDGRGESPSAGSSATIYEQGSSIKGYSDVIEADIEVTGDGTAVEIEVTN